jgi:hypothetical protein
VNEHISARGDWAQNLAGPPHSRTLSFVRFVLGCFVGVVMMLAQPAAAHAADAPRKPNIVVILADDLGFGEIGAFGS